jgi:hypothetical protein
MKNLILTITLTLGFTTIGYCDEPPPFNPGQPQGIPIDGGSILLLGAAVGYGIKKVNGKKSDAVETE